MSVVRSRSRSLFFVMPFLVGAGLALAGCFFFINPSLATVVLEVVLVLGSAPYIWRILKDFLRGHFGVDVIALLAIIAALLLRQFVAGGVILFMLSGGEALEEYALVRARQRLTQLLSRAPSFAHRKDGNEIQDIPVDEAKSGDVLLVKPGEVVPVDGTILEGVATVDESMITGESLPVEKQQHQTVSSGSINAGAVFLIRAMRESRDSKYQQIVQLVRAAEQQKAPLVRLADRFSGWFTLVTLALSGGAWFLSGDPLRALAVLVVATPCPLIIATPVAVMSAISLAAARGIVVKNGGALENLARAKAFIFDKTGTITFGEPRVSHLFAVTGTVDEVMRLGASLDQFSAHVLARSLVNAAHQKALPLLLPTHFDEQLGVGVKGELDHRPYVLGKLDFLRKMQIDIPKEVLEIYEKRQTLGEKIIFLAQDHHLLGGIAFTDEIRKDTANVFSTLRKHGVKEIILLSGDKTSVVKKIAAQVAIQQVMGDMLPEEKVTAMKKIQKTWYPVAMVGDGVNDAPALATADVGIAMGAHGVTVASETADVVIAVDTLSRVSEAHEIARRMMHIALQSIGIGIGVSLFLMVLAALGWIPPVSGAVLQEGLDVVVIVNALRVGYRPKRYQKI